jgi:serine/threonine-protein kinase
VIGTPTYMAPEQCRGVAIDHRADLYALGCVIYELCCGRPPFLGEGTGDVLAAHIHLPVPPMAPHSPDLPAAVEQLVRRLLAKVPADRVQSAEELIRAIDAVTSEQAAVTSSPRRAVSVMTSPTVTTLSGSASTSMLLPRGARRRWPIAAFSISLAAITVVIVALVMRHGDGTPVIASHPADTPAAPVPAQPPPGTAPATPPGAAPADPTPAAPNAEPPTPAPAAPPSAGAAPAAPAAPPSAGAAPTAPAAPPSAGAAPTEPTAPPHAHDPRSGPDRTAAPAASEPASPDLGRAEPRAPAGSGAPRTVPRPRPPHAPVTGDTVDVAIDSTPAGAQVVFDGAVLGTTPYRGTLARRDREIKLVLRLAGYADKVVVARESQPISERVTLARKAAPPVVKGTKTDRDRSVNPF